ncbi:hypothetical protein [Oceanicella sp. SM1341]|uniref:hypothetical protein n=1 Tax=Oceanicella sp. SM1341 TaxID=1548889 RepID=UPI0013007C98|nr:hypothetical protein [Oceanicella sp. SM1341]
MSRQDGRGNGFGRGLATGTVLSLVLAGALAVLGPPPPAEDAAGDGTAERGPAPAPEASQAGAAGSEAVSPAPETQQAPPSPATQAGSDAAPPQVAAAPAGPAPAPAEEAPPEAAAPADSLNARAPAPELPGADAGAQAPVAPGGMDRASAAAPSGAQHAAAPGTPAWQAYAAEADAAAPDDAPVLSILLEVLPQGGVALEDLAGMGLPVSFVLPSDLPGLAERAALLRGMGYELFLRPAGGSASDGTDVAVARLETALSRAPEAVGVMLPAGQASALRGPVARRGLALVVLGPERGSEPAQGPELEVARMLDAAKAGGTQETGAVLEDAARELSAATARKGVVLLGHTWPDTAREILSWALAGNEGRVALAPATAQLPR